VASSSRSFKTRDPARTNEITRVNGPLARDAMIRLVGAQKEKGEELRALHEGDPRDYHSVGRPARQRKKKQTHT